MTTAEVTQTVTCYECDRERPKDATNVYELYSTPWDDVGTTSYLCNDEFGHAEVERENGREVFDSWKYYESCVEVLTDSGWSDFRYFECVGCYRTICEQNPKNGWHVQYRINDPEEYEQVCLKCYQDEILENGISRESVENGELSGMFFNRGELDDWEKVMDYIHINESKTVQQVLDNILGWMDEDYKVVIDYERMGIGGLEGYISVYRKKVE
tara:strand:+ start:267 stop:905 length:639 start_codon:yes stop_codon:yes gene_type:complete